ncbi:calmodulin-like protein [Dinothrombium tinctorium]|uniref:Calmodulin-like protein n=1 Tax=Dinothrombium tinctorium TaxID=1965070 RepID=A0A3S3Q489_9ACAR|nr:calmodulin-like protein [Dinothrombium tinctorium]RWS13334.1 calmodulin-like protein [Dinothrombium tinctorium]RWS13604.1 calmodulin-like protein [Dinothrombium tinctorium]RWS13664.1 calmodulin-like protein [Dinothrombium tinctorium]
MEPNKESENRSKKFKEILLPKNSASLDYFRKLGIADALIDAYLEAFAMFDKNQDGIVSLKEIESLFINLDERFSLSDISEIVKEADKSKKDGIDFVEFVEILHTFLAKCTTTQLDEYLMQAFHRFDLDGNGTISWQDLKGVMIKLGQPITDAEAKQMIKIADKKNIGAINMQEFIALMKE